MNISPPLSTSKEQRETVSQEQRQPDHESRFQSKVWPPSLSQGQTTPEQSSAKGSRRREEWTSRNVEPERLADMLFFEYLLHPLAESSNPGNSSSLSQAFLCQPEDPDALSDWPPNGWASLLDEVGMQVPAGMRQAVQATLFMPALGRIGLNARNLPPRGWDIDLDCAEADTAQYLRGQHLRCQNDLSSTLGQPVVLNVLCRGAT